MVTAEVLLKLLFYLNILQHNLLEIAGDEVFDTSAFQRLIV